MTTPVCLDLASEAATEALAQALAPLAGGGDVIALSGGLGAGKSVFARAFIRARTRADEEVPSPTFTLVQTYEGGHGGVPIHHFDLYRLDRPDDAFELGIEEAFADGIALIEWPERLGALLPARRLAITLLPGASPTARHARLEGGGDWPARLKDANLAV